MIHDYEIRGVILDKPWVRESNFYNIYDPSKKLVRCTICERRCVIASDKTGFAGTTVT